MNSGQFDEEAVFQIARKIGDVAARTAYLDQVCGRDPRLRQRIDALLYVQEHEEEFLKSNTDVAITAEHMTITEGPGTKIGRYKLLQKIGEGGFGVVYMAEQKEPVKRRVALKIVKLGMNTKQVVARFESERQALALMDHPNVAKVLDAGATETGRPYFVMELVRGVSITKYCDDSQLTTRQRLELFISVTNAVQHAHLKGIIHRDIKPSNILVTMHDGVPVPKVIDFGIAKATQQELTEKTLFTEYGQFIGTPAYMSPEQAEMSGLDIDTRTDIYSLGVLLYELLVGHTPIDARDLLVGGYDEIRRRIKEEQPRKPSTRVSTLDGQERTSVARCRGVDPSQLTSELKGDLDWIVLKALEKDRTRRYLTASSFAEDIKRHLHGEPVSAAAPSASYRIRKYVRRHRAALAVAATIAGLLVAGTIVSSVQWLRAERARTGEAEQRIVAESKEREANAHRQRAQEERAAAVAAERKSEQLAYARAMQLAQSDWEGGSLTRLEQTLADTASYPDRGFEWYYWQNQLHQERRTIYAPVGQISGVRLAADQRHIVVNNFFRSYRLDVATGNVLAVYGSGPISPDGQWLADGPFGEHGTTVIDTTTGMRTVVDLPATQEKVALSPDGAILITIDYAASTSHVWDVRTSTERYEIKPALYGAEFSPDGQWFAGNVNPVNRSEIELRRTSDGEQIRAAEAIGGSFLGFAPDSRHLARWDGATRQIHLHNTRDLSDVKQLPCEQEPEQFAFSPDGTYVAILAINNRIVDIYEVETRRLMSTYRAKQISDIAFSHAGDELIAVSLHGTVKFFPVESREFIHIGSRVSHLQFSGDGSRLLLITEEGARLIDVASRKVLAEYPNVTAATIFPDGQRVITVPPYVDSDESRSTTITIADDKGESLRVFDYGDRVLFLVIAPDGRHIFVATPGGSDSLLEAETGKRTFQASSPDTHACAFLPDGRRFALAFDGESQIRIYDVATGRRTDSIPCETEGIGQRLEFSPDGTRIAMSYANEGESVYGVCVYDMARKGRIRNITGHAGPVYASCFSPDGRRIFTMSMDGTIRLWDVENGFELLSLRGYAESVPTFPGRALSPDGRMIAVADPEGVFLRQAATPEQVAAWQRPPSQPVDTRWWQRLGGIQDWLVLAPIHLGEQDDFTDCLDNQQLTDEAELDPSADEITPVSGEKLTWRRVTTSDCVLDLQMVTSPAEDHCLAYAVTHIYSDATREGVRLLFGSDDLAKVYLNGKQVHECRIRRAAIPGDDEVRIDLKKGKNVLVCKVIDDEQDWGVSAQIVGDDYQPIPGVTTGLEP